MAKIFWTGGAKGVADLNGNYEKAANWSNHKEPTDQDDVTLGGSGYTVKLNGHHHETYSAHSFKISSGVELDVIDRTNMIGDPLAFKPASLQVDGVLRLAGTTLSPDAYTVSSGGVLAGFGTITGRGTIDGKLIVDKSGPGTLVLSYGSMEISGSLEGKGEFTGEHLTFDAGSQVSVGSLVSNLDLNINGDLDLRHTDATFHYDVHLGGVLTLKNSTLDGATLSNGTVINYGKMTMIDSIVVSTSIENDGSIIVKTPHSVFGDSFDAISGKGTITIGEGSVANFSDTVAEGQTIDLGANGTAMIFGGGQYFHGSIADWAGSSKLVLPGFAQNGEEVLLSYMQNESGTGGELDVTDAEHSFSVHLVGEYDPSGFTTAYGNNGLQISYHEHLASGGDAGRILHI